MSMHIKTEGLDCSITLGAADNEGWMRARIEAVTPHFRGDFSCTIEIMEFKYLIKSLEQLEQSPGKNVEVTWSNMEANIELKFTQDHIGRLSGEYRLNPHAFDSGHGSELSGNFCADQTFIPIWLKQAKQVLSNAS